MSNYLGTTLNEPVEIVQPVKVTNPDGSDITAVLEAYSADMQKMNYNIEQLISQLAFLANVRGIAADLRTTILSGTVTTVSSLTNVASIGSVNAQINSWAAQNTAALLSNYNNVQ